MLPLFLILLAKPLSFTIRNEVIWRCFIDVLCQVEEDPVYSYFAENLSRWILKQLVSASIDVIVPIWVDLFAHIMNYIDLLNVKSNLHSWHISHLNSDLLPIIYIVGLNLLKMCWKSLHLCSWGILSVLFFSSNIFVWLWYQGSSGPTKWGINVSSF